ncbi:MAG: GNAT family N-acetyltransferase [Bdellovibrionales bacterium]|nr:GNAT family N-acetyltransferase [Bdellovibrionales bacterium]
MNTNVKLKSIQPLIPAIDVNLASDFYQKILGFKSAWIDGNPATMAIVYRGDIEIFLTINPDIEHAKKCSLRIAVENIEALYDEYSSKNIIHPNGELSVEPWGLKEFTITDLNGVCIVFHEMPQAQKKRVINPNKELETTRLLLKPLETNHFQSMHSIYSNPEAMKNWHTLPHATFEETEQILKDYMSLNSAWILQTKENGQIIGLINCFSVSENKNTGMGYILSPEFQGKGYAKEASEKALEHLFKSWNIPYVELWIYEDNTPSIALAKKLGFKLENTFQRSAPNTIVQKNTGIYWLRQNDWWLLRP